MNAPHEGLSLADGRDRVDLPFRDLWIGVASLGGDLSELEIEAYVLDVLPPDAHSHNLIAQALNEESLAAGNDHPVAYSRGRAMTTEPPTIDAGSDAAPDDVELPEAFADVDPQMWSTLDRLSRALHVQGGDLQETLDAVLRSACQVVPGAGAAGLNLYVRGKFEPQVVLGEAPHELDEVQRSTGDGPCIEASRDQAIVDVRDMRVETRWAGFPARAVGLGVLSMLCVPLWVDDQRLGSLSLYGTVADAFDPQTRNLAGLFATHAALALADARRLSYLNQALQSRDVIGQAKGILMAHHRITAGQAFDRLSSASQALNVKLATLAEVVTETGELPS